MPAVPRKLLQDVLAGIKPAQDERQAVLATVKAFVGKLQQQLAKRRIKAKVILGGSFAKDTWLAGDYDVDLFVAFDPKKHAGADLSELLAKALASWKPERLHGSRDYFWVRGDVRFEIVPVLGIRKPSESRNVTDFSPLHVAWVNKAGRKHKDDIMLAKKFCKSAKVYGAESYIHGFSGHVLDALVIHHQGFLPLLRAAAKWTPKVVIDPKNIHKGKALMVLNASKIAGPLVLVDPVQPGRNAAAAVSQENFDRFVAAAQAFLARPSRAFFEDRTLDVGALRKRGHLVLAEAKPLDGKEDVVGARLGLAFEFLRARLGQKGFTLKDAGWEWDKKKPAVFWFLCKDARLPEKMSWEGPPIAMQTHAAAFRKKYRTVTVRNGKLWAVIKRPYTTPETLLKDLLKDDYVRTRAAGARVQ
jgi:tRNA nucleotidyltransferase (CCA-adding enzyme)